MNLTWKSVAKVGSKIYDLSDVDNYKDKEGYTAQVKSDGSGIEFNQGATEEVTVVGGVLNFINGLFTSFTASSGTTEDVTLSEGVLSFVGGLFTGFTAGSSSSDVGLIGFFPGMSAAPTGWLKAEGSAVLISSYSALATAIYVGDALNATALSGYKCTNPANPTGTRSTSGTYIVIPDLRDMVLKGMPASGRVINSFQDHQFQDHIHSATSVSTSISTVHKVYGGGSVPGILQTYVYDANGETGTNVGAVTTTTTTTTTIGNPTNGNHGTETLVKNIALLACIKY